MGDVAITKSKSITIRGGQVPSSPVIPETPEDPVTIPPTPPHNNLSGLQGGSSTERYHIDKDQWDAVDNANAPDAGNPFATMADVGGSGMPPIDGSYASQALMIADQASQTAQYIYFDGTAYWEYLGTTTPSIADYRQISGGGSDTNKVSYNVADGKTASERQQARDNINVSSGIPQTIATTGTLTVTRTSNCLIFTGAGAVRLDTVNAGIEGEEIIIINQTGQSMDINSTGSTVNSFGNFLGLINNGMSLFRYSNSRWRPIDQYQVITASAAAGINSYPLRVYKSNGSTLIFEVRSQGNVNITGLGSTSIGALNVQQDTSGATRQIIRCLDNSGNAVAFIENAGTIFHARSNGATYSVRRDELPFNYPQTVATAGTINNLSLTNEGIKLLILTAATDLTGVIPVTTTTGRLLRIESRVGGGVIIRHESASSTAANRFTLPGAVDLTIANGEVYTFIYTNGRWRRVF